MTHAGYYFVRGANTCKVWPNGSVSAASLVAKCPTGTKFTGFCKRHRPWQLQIELTRTTSYQNNIKTLLMIPYFRKPIIIDATVYGRNLKNVFDTHASSSGKVEPFQTYMRVAPLEKVSGASEAWGLHQCCRCSWNTAEVTPNIIYFYYRKIYLQDQSIQKLFNLILKKNVF